MAHDTSIELDEHKAHEHDHHSDDSNLWSGGKEPFKASYGKLMMWYFLLSDAFTFAGFLIAYGALRFTMNTWPVPDYVFKTAPFGIENGPLIFVTFMTFVLIVSSVTVLRAVQEGKLENQSGVVKWLVITILGGATFLGCQAWEWNNLISTEGTTIYTNPFSAHTEYGRYLSADELKQYANQNGWQPVTQSYTDHHGNAAELTYYMGGGVNFFPKADHHGHAPQGDAVNIKPGTSYIITYDHDLGIYKEGAYLVTDETGAPKKDDFGKEIIKTEPYGPKAFGTLFFFITGFHGFHVFSGLIILLVVAVNSWSGFYGSRKNGYEMVEKVGLYWHFVDLVWVFVFLVFYLI